MKSEYNCGNCGISVEIAASEVTKEGIVKYSVTPHECFPEISETRTENTSAWPTLAIEQPRNNE